MHDRITQEAQQTEITPSELGIIYGITNEEIPPDGMLLIVR